MAEFLMPSLGADMERGTLVRWFIKPGDKVKRGDIVAEVETQKGIIDVEIFEDGVVSELLVSEGAEADVGAPLALLNGANTDARPAAPTVEALKPGEPPVAAVVAPALVKQAPSREMRVSPAAKKLARELGVDLETLTGSGPGGAIGLADVKQAAKAAPLAPEIPSRPGEQTAAMREAIAVAMSRSKREIPHYYLGLDIDMKPAMDWLAEENRKRSVTDRLLYAPLLIKAVAKAVHDVPELNGFWIDGAFRPSEAVHVGVAISLRDGGLIAPAIHNADKKSLDELMNATRDLVMRARTGKLRGSELSDSTITVTSLGEKSVDTVYGIIYPPQVAIVGFGEVVERPWAVDGAIAIRPIVRATLSADHRASVGHRGGVFLRRVHDLLMEPSEL